MGEIELKGSQIEELREALSSAFTENSLKQMLRLRLNWRWDEIKQGETYKDRLFNLIEQAETEGKIEQFVISAARWQSNNSQLQRFVEAYADNFIGFDNSVLATESLFDLLSILKNLNHFQVIADLVRRILPKIETHRSQEVKDFEKSELSSWFKGFLLLKLLLEDYPLLNQRSSLLTLVENFLKEESTDASIKQQLKEWLEKTDPNFNRQHDEAEQTSVETLQAYLMIMVNPEKSKMKLRAFASLLCISPTGNRKEIPVHLNSESNERGVLRTQNELPNTIEQFIKNVECELEKPDNKLNCVSYDLTIELFLPSESLCEPVDWWEIKDDFDNPVCLGSKHRLVLRSYDRVAKPGLKNNFSKSWHSATVFLKQNPDVESLQKKIKHLDQINCNRLTKLEEELRQKIGLKVICALPKSEGETVKFFQAMLKSGIPFAFWTRCRELPSCDVRAGIDQFLTLELLLNYCNLLEKVREKRALAFEDRERPEKSWENHLSVLWDDWERMPTLESF